jgi:NAD(P)-dependent dehydrogenase (short-subunit alcohol dehydrogenase family)
VNVIDLSNRGAVVTGGGSGIGLAIARRLQLSGARVEIWGRNAEKLAHAVEDLGGPDAVSAQAVDVSDAEAVERAARAAVSNLGAVDILINCAAVTPEIRPMVEVSLAAWRETMAINLDGVFYCCRQFAPDMVARSWGRIVNVSSIAGKEGNPFQAAYSASKGGVIAFTKSLAKELATSGVTVNAVSPTLFDTPLSRWAVSENPAAMRIALEKIPMRRMGDPDEAAAMVAWIASDQCSFTTGFTFDLSGGRATY